MLHSLRGGESMVKKRLFQRIKVSCIFINLFLLLNIFLFNFADSVYATTIRINRPKIRLNISSGGSGSGSIIVSNPSEEGVDVKVYLEDWEYEETQDGIKKFFPPGTTALSCARWISFYPADFTIFPYGSQELFYSIKVPDDVEGGHYAVLFFETVMGGVKNEKGVDVLMKGRIGSLFYIEADSTNKEIQISELSLSQRRGGLQVSALLKNIGNVDVTAKGTFNIIDQEGMVFARGQFNDAYTFPGNQARILSTWADTLPAGNYDLIITLDLGGVPLVEEVKIGIDSSGEIVNLGSRQ